MSHKLRTRLITLATAVVLVLAIACSSSNSSPTRSTPSGEITVFAASSLTDAFNAIATAFKAKYPGTSVTFNFAGTPTLRAQLEQGARADVFASANAEQMQFAIDAGVVEGTPSTFATNRLVVITPAGGEVRTLAGLATDGALIVLALPGVPVGGYSRQALANLSGTNGLPAGYAGRVLANVVSEETNVRQVVAKVSLGEADAGIVYQTDAASEVRDNMDTIEIPDEANVIATYPVAHAKDGGNSVTGAAFIAFVLSTDGQAILAEYGFGPAS
jgi:molybdate transport system substrate-binding protein